MARPSLRGLPLAGCHSTECGLGLLVSQPPHGPHPGPLTRDGPETPPLPAVRGPSPSASRRRGRGAPPCPSLPRFELARSACAAPFEPTHMPPVTALPRSTRDDSHVAQNDCTIIVRTLSLLGEKGEGVVFSRPLRARRRESSESLSQQTQVDGRQQVAWSAESQTHEQGGGQA